jgi:Tfp pilus assembly protein PilE
MKPSNDDLLTLISQPLQVAWPRSSNKGARRGTTFLELVLVITAMAVLISLSIPSFHRAVEQSRANLAGASLGAIWSAERLYWLEYGTYTSDLTALQSQGLLDPTIVNSSAFYTYQVTSADTNSFIAVATRVASTGWNGSFSIDNTGVLSGVLQAPGEPNIIVGFQ